MPVRDASADGQIEPPQLPSSAQQRTAARPASSSTHADVTPGGGGGMPTTDAPPLRTYAVRPASDVCGSSPPLR